MRDRRLPSSAALPSGEALAASLAESGGLYVPEATAPPSPLPPPSATTANPTLNAVGLACLGTWSDARRSLAVQEQIRTLLLPQAAVAAKDLALPQTAGSAVLQRCGDDAAFLPPPSPSAVRLPGLTSFCASR